MKTLICKKRLASAGHEKLQRNIPELHSQEKSLFLVFLQLRDLSLFTLNAYGWLLTCLDSDSALARALRSSSTPVLSKSSLIPVLDCTPVIFDFISGTPIEERISGYPVDE
jgi:hypothetical protein